LGIAGFYVVTDGQDGGHVVLAAKNIEQIESYLQVIAHDGGAGGLVQVSADHYHLESGEFHSAIHAQGDNAQSSGDINIQARTMTAQGSVLIVNDSNTSVGDMNVNITDDLSLVGGFTTDNTFSGFFGSNLEINTNLKQSDDFEKGVINIHAGNLSLLNGAIIGGVSFGPNDAPMVNINVDEQFVMEGFYNVSISPSIQFVLNSGIITNAYVGSTIMSLLGYEYTNPQYVGHSGDIQITAKVLNIQNRAAIANNTFVGDAGTIKIRADRLLISGGGLITSGTGGSGQGGDIDIVVSGDIQVTDFTPLYSLSSRIEANSVGTQENMGSAGNIHIQADTLYVGGKGTITANTKNAAGGNINLDICKWLFLEKGGEITSSVQGGNANSGNISISQPIFIIANQGFINAQADAGNGGDIFIETQNLLSSADTVISASSRLGIDGKIEIESPEEDVSNAFILLTTDFSNKGQLALAQCEIQKLDDISQFLVNLNYAGKLKGVNDFQE